MEDEHQPRREWTGSASALQDPPAVRLSPRQIQCLILISEGHTYFEIARALKLSPRTVEHYMGGACARLGVRNRVQAVARAIALGLIPAPSRAGP